MKRITQFLTMLVLLLTVATGAWAQAAVTLSDTEDNSTTLSDYDGQTADVTLSGRTLYKDGSWNTLCLPFDLTLSGSVLDGATAKTLTSTAYDSDAQTLTLTFGEAVSTLEAGKPYIIKWESATSNTVDLSTLTANYEMQDGDVLTGTLSKNVKITIADGATVTLSDATINGVSDDSYDRWAGITCKGDATIILEGTNTVKGFNKNYPGIQVGPTDKTLTINGTGSLTASSNGNGAGIGGGNLITCGNIVIEGGTITATGDGSAGIGGGYNSGHCGNISILGGTITATGGMAAAGIGCGYESNCGDITISGGTITATGGIFAAGIGGGMRCSCGDITITDGVTSVTATMGDSFATYSIGAGNDGTCGTVTIGGTVGAITESPYTYTPSALSAPRRAPRRAASTDLVSPVFEGVTISSTTANVSTTYADFVGCFSPVSISGEDKTMLYLGADNKLYYPNAAMQIGSCRAYFKLNDELTAGDKASAVRAFRLNFSDGETTAITATSVTNPTNEAAAWYTLDGRRLAGKPAVRGIYVNNGKKVVIK